MCLKERLTGFGPVTDAWQAPMLPLHHNRIKLPYSELHIGTPHLESNQLLRCGFHCEELHSSLRFSGIRFFSDREDNHKPHTYVQLLLPYAAIKADET